MQSFEEVYDRLNQGQRKAVDHIDGPMMVLAGAGTGKTQVIAMRIANLLRNGVEPYNILCLTFTDSGVSAMRSRLVQILGSGGYYVKVHTFHSFCNEIISEHPERFVFAKELVALGDLEKVEVVAQILDSKGVSDPLKTFGSPYFYSKDIQAAIAVLKREGVGVERLSQMVGANREFLEQIGDKLREFGELNAREVGEAKIDELRELALSKMKDQVENIDVSYLYKSLVMVLEHTLAEAQQNPTKTGKLSYKIVRDGVDNFYESLVGQLDKQESLLGIFGDYQQILNERGRYDYEDMIGFVLRELEQDANLRAQYLERYQYVLIDEYQDTNAMQNSLARIFGSGVEKPNIFVVGDDDQAIFRFQGANLENVLAFYDHYTPEVELVTLVDNYRSHQTILNASGSVIANNIYRAQAYLPSVDKQLKAAARGSGEKLKLATFERDEDELSWIAQEIGRLQKEGVELAEIAVLLRNNAQCEEVVKYLAHAQVPYVLEKGESVFEVVVVRQFLQLLRVLVDPLDDRTMFYLMHARFLKMPQNSVLKLHLWMQKERPDSKGRRHLIEVIQDDGQMSDVGVGDEDKELLKAFAMKVLIWRERVFNELPLLVIEKVFVESGLMADVERQVERLVLLSAFKRLFEVIHEYAAIRRGATLEEILKYLDSHEEHGVDLNYHLMSADGQGVRVMTVHKSKGLEFEHVFLPECSDALWGKSVRRDKLKLPLQLVKHDLSVLTKESLEDERRLFYVALTRGKKDVVLSFAKKNGGGKEQLPSRFILEIGEDHLEKMEMNDFKASLLPFLNQANPMKMVEKDILRSRLEQLRISATNLNDYLNCPRMFYYKHFIKAPMMRSKYMALGTATHEALEALYRSQMAPPFGGKEDSRFEILSKEEMLAVFERVLWKETLEVKDFEQSLEHGKIFLSAYYDHYVGIGNLIVPIEIEYDFGRDHVYLVDGEARIPLTGKVDMMELVDPLTRQVVFYDFKTGNPDKKISELKEGGAIWRQMVFYKLLSQLSKKFSKQYVMVCGCVEFVERDKRGNFMREKVEIEEAACEQVRSEIVEVWGAINRLEFECRSEQGRCKDCEKVLEDINED